jgi:competence protein ComEC
MKFCDSAVMATLMQHISKKRAGYCLNWQDWFTLAPLALMAGVLLYFAMPEDPSLWAGVLLLPCIAALIWLRYDTCKLQYAGWVTLLVSGFCAATLHSSYSTTHFIDKQYRYASITGKIAEVIEGDGRIKLIVEHVTSPDISRPSPMRVRLSLRKNKTYMQVGDWIHTKATLFAPSRPALPNTFDFTQYFYFRGIDAVGYVTGKMALSQPRTEDTSEHYLSVLRRNSANYLKDTMSQPASGVAIALTTGIKDAITTETRDAFTASSLGHMLAISGMHMSILCGTMFWIIRAIASCVPVLALNYPIKKIAAIAGLICGALYLTLADFPISAIRAYIMIAVLFLAILCDRQSDTLRCIVLAALAIVIVNPHAVGDIGFQLSFAATLALILVYRRVRHYNIIRQIHKRHIGLRIVMYCAQLMFSSFIAGLITAPLVAYHFHHVALFGIIANMLALPVLSFLVAPALLLSLPAAPLGLAPAMLSIAEYGLDWIIQSAMFVAQMPNATHYVAPFSAVVAIGITIGIFLLLIIKNMKIYAALLLVLLVTITAVFYHRIDADMLIAEDGSAIAVNHQGQWLLLKGTPRNFHVSLWEQMLGVSMQRNKDTWQCDDAGCDGTLKQHQVRVRFDYKVDAPLCLEDSDIVVSTFYSNRWKCASANATRIDRDALERRGGHVITIEDSISVWHSCLNAPKRTWKRCTS